MELEDMPDLEAICGSTTDSKFTVKMVVTLPYTENEFKDATVQDAFKKGVAAAAGTSSDKVTINSVKAVARRRMLLATGVDVDFSVEAADATAATELASSDKLSQANLNTELSKQGVKEITAIK